MRRARAPFFLLTTLAMALALAGCAMAGFAEPVCYDSLDCPSGYTCNQWNQCEKIPVLTSLVHLELYPVQGSGSVATQIAGLDLGDAAQSTEFELNKGAAFTGQVTSPLGVTGSLVARRTAEFDSRRLSWLIDVGEDGYFEGLVAPATMYQMGSPSLDYELQFLPANRTDFPQLAILGVEVPAAGLDMELRYPEYPPADLLEDQSDPLLVKLRVLQSEAYPHPVTGIEVEGVTDAGLRTNLVTPDEQGYAYLRLPLVRRADEPETPSYAQSLTLTMHPAASTIRLPTVTVADLPVDQADLGTFYLGDVPASQSVNGVVVDRSGSPVGNCQLRFLASSMGNGSLEQVVAADPEGNFSTTLPQGTYKVTAVPSLNAAVGISATVVEVMADMGPMTVSLDERPALTGTVRDPNGLPVADVLLTAERTADWTGMDDGLTREFETASDPDGNFMLRVDPGAYRLTFVPPPAAGLPRLQHLNRVITAGVKMPQAETTLPEPEVIDGHIYSAGGSPMCGATINVYSSGEGDAVLIGQAVSGNSTRDGCSGSFSVVIPSSP